VPASENVTDLLMAWAAGDRQAFDNLVPIVYEELRRIARRYIEHELPGHPLQTTALVHEAYIRLIDVNRVHWNNRAHFLAVSANVMRRILVDYARSLHAGKRGGNLRVTDADADRLISPERPADFIALDAALERLASVDYRKSQVVELRYFGGLNVEETAEVLQVSTRTVQSDWSYAKAWLFRELTIVSGNDAEAHAV
jgi:RNA polymerase sigma factor (TIGR02999 family)